MVGALGFALALAAAAPTTPQQIFADASAALDRDNYAEALAGFEALEHHPGISPRTHAIAELRAGLALHGLRRDADAAAALRHALTGVPEADATLRGDRSEAYRTLAMIEENALEFDAARQDYAAALANASPGLDQIADRAGLARVTMFSDPARALALTDEALARLPTLPDAPKTLRGQLRTLRGRVLLNAGRPRDALQELRASVADLGGMTMRVDRDDLIARSDLAIAALLAGLPDQAKEYLAFSGSGTVDSDFAIGAQMDPPPCGVDGLQPQDVAVIQFGIADDGQVIHPEPIYGSMTGDRALLFARAAQGWSWDPDKIRPIAPLFRSVLRLELRCSTSTPRPGVESFLAGRVGRWLDDRGVAPAPEASSAAAALPLLLAELARRDKAGGDPVAVLPVLLALVGNPLVPEEERRGWLDRAVAIADKEKAPLLARLGVRVPALFARWRHDKAGTMMRVAELRRIADEPAVAADPEAEAAMRLLVAEQLGGPRERAAAAPYLQAIDGDARLQHDDALRQAAAGRLASLQAASGQLDLARATFARSGLSAQQCALVDLKPVVQKKSFGPDDYPKEALRWRIAGWAVAEYDVQANGVPADVRTVIAYPPFVFGKPANEIVSRSRYTQSFRPDGQLGCGGDREKVRFASH